MKDFLQPPEIKIKKSLSLTKLLFVNERVAHSTVTAMKNWQIAE